jgi:hypothetical protein
MGSHQKLFNSLNEAVKILASSKDDLQHRLLVACKDYLAPLEKREMGEGLYEQFEILSNELSLGDEKYQDVLLSLGDAQAANLVDSICDFQVKVCEEYYKPGSFF